MHGTDGNHASRAGRNTGQHAIVGVGGAQAGRSARGCAQQQKPARSPARHLPSQRDEGDRRFHNRDHPNTPKAGRQDFLAEALVPGQAGEQPIADLRPSHRNHYIADRARCGIIKRSMRQPTCAIATAAEMKLKGLAADIAGASEHAGQETAAVARRAAAALA